MSEPQEKPLQGKRILITRSSEQAGTFSARLRELGAIPEEFPTIRLCPPRAWKPLDNALQRLFSHEAYSWLVFTSANGVSFSLDRAKQLEYPLERLTERTRLVAIGRATAARLADYGLAPALLPAEAVGESLAAAILDDARQRGIELKGRRALLLRAEVARQALVTELEKAGLAVDDISAYENVAVQPEDQRGREILHLLRDRQLAILTFTSSSTVRNFMQWLRSCEEKDAGLTAAIIENPRLKIATIGPITSQTAREQGLPVHIQGHPFTIDGLIEAIVEYEEKHD